jgi:AraC-like DNA-binding protein
MTDDVSSRRVAAPLVSLTGCDTAAAVGAIGQLYAGSDVYCRPVTADFRFKYVGVGDDDVSMRRLRLDGYLRGTITTGNSIVIQSLTRGQAHVHSGAGQQSVGPGVPPTMLPTDRAFQIEFEDVDQRLVHINQDLLRQVASEQYLLSGQLHFLTSAPPDAAAVLQWNIAVADAVAVLRTDGPASASWRESKRTVAQALLELYPLLAKPLPGVLTGRGNARFVAALRYVQTHAHQPVTVADIADAAGLSVRGLQEMFQRQLGRSPIGYLHDVRLDNVHTELQSIEPAGSTVAQVAQNWGFTHMGRLSATYRERFGEYPSQTLRSRQHGHTRE